MKPKNLYQVADREGTIIEPCTTIKEIAEMLGKTEAAISCAATQGYLIAGKYNVEMVDTQLSKRRDADLLIEYDRIRRKILRRYRKEWKDEINSKG